MQFNIDGADYDVNLDSMCPEVPCPEVPTAEESACESIASGGSDSESDIQSESECEDSTVAMTSKLKLAAGNYIVKSSCIQVYCSIWKVVQIVIQNHFLLNGLHFYMHFFTVLILQYVVLWK